MTNRQCSMRWKFFIDPALDNCRTGPWTLAEVCQTLAYILLPTFFSASTPYTLSLRVSFFLFHSHHKLLFTCRQLPTPFTAAFNFQVKRLSALVDLHTKPGRKGRETVIDWRFIASDLGRTYADCHSKWNNLLRSQHNATLKKGPFEPDEDRIIVQRHVEWVRAGQQWGALWPALGKELGRRAQNVKQRWDGVLSKHPDRYSHLIIRTGATAAVAAASSAAAEGSDRRAPAVSNVVPVGYSGQPSTHVLDGSYSAAGSADIHTGSHPGSDRQIGTNWVGTIAPSSYTSYIDADCCWGCFC